MNNTQIKLRRKLIIFNVLFVILGALSVCVMAIRPFLSVNASYVVTADTMRQLAPELDDKADLDEILGDGVTVKMGIDITPKMILKSVTTKDNEKFVQDEVVGPLVDKIIADLKPTLEVVINNAVKSVAKTQVKDQLNDSIKDAFGTETNVTTKLDEADIDLDDAIDTIFEAFTAENATVESFTTAIVTEVNDAMEKLRTTYPDEASNFTDISNADLQTAINDVLDQVGLVDDDGNILDIESAISTLMDKFLNEENSSSDPDEGGADPLSASVYAEGDGGETLTDNLKNIIYDKLPDSVNSIIAMVLKILAGVLAFFMLTWAYIAIMALLKSIIAKNPGIFTGFVCVIAGLLQIIIGLVLVYGVTMILSGKINIEMINELKSQIPAGFSISLASSLTITAGCCLAKWILNIPYHFMKKNLKRSLKSNPIVK